jgi:predicted permease
MSPERARFEARKVFGGLEHVKEDVRDTWLARLTEAAVQDVRYGARSLGKNRGYAAAVIITMALGIGATSAIFSVVNAVVLRPLPYGRGADIVLLRQPRSDVETTGFSLDDIDRLKADATTLDAVVEYHNMYFILLGGEEPARVATGVVSWDYFHTLGVSPVVGRTFTAADDGAGAPATLILSYDYWQRAFGGDPGVVGRVLQMNDRAHTVVGVLPDVPIYPQANDLYMPRSACPLRMSASQLDRRGSGMAEALGRRRPGVTMAQVANDLERISHAWQAADPAAYPAARGHGLTAVPLRREFSRNFESTLVVLLCTAGFVLLIVCASVTNLGVARTMRRERELALRSALGATRARIFRQVMTEGVVLSVAGAVAGLLVATAAADLLMSYAARFTVRASEIRVDRSVMAFTLALSLTIGFVGSLLPALSRRRLSVPDDNRSGRAPARHADIRRALIVAQVAASFMLLVGAGLTIRSLMKLTGVDPGFRSAEVLTFQLDMNFTKYKTAPEQVAFLERVEARLRGVPGVSVVGAAGTLPFLDRSGVAAGRFRIEGEPETAPPSGRASILLASDDYFRAIVVPLLAGRFFTAADDLDSDKVVIVNETLARRHWPGTSAIGKRIGGGGYWPTIVGVVGSVRQQLSLQPVDEIYLPMRQEPYVTTNWALRSSVDLQTLAPAVREAIYDVDADQPVHRLQPLDDIRVASLAPPRLTATLLGLFAALALLITAAGIAGVIAFSVSQRTQEFGVRVALGARRAEVASMVVGEGVRLAAKGLALGAVGALLLGGLLSTLLFGIGPTDSITYLSVSSVLLIAAALACLVPALRAAAVDPMQALRTT